ncbi:MULTISPECIES: DUF2092 domain-containing protein [unclassified Pseudomonas]|uniref:DUF2092 domain-containing protein n=1 Tax=unclassified Pseudomonas TaxID=196821 RepID=UPI002AC8FB8E|nr:MULTISPECIES: DUF2092 domain-containing protein [unclassified Pseudomonas]MEB0044149.1 DUF2092 domain-containing protein [Pseudomonas sp. Dout3]MEB0094914.1 DUF2092 domain-containing protein [Pseudomonas sp. DC1.2]WPX59727.1 DUF2092 domain-containing protein [Pseudomonas sp. DC1.2]
MLRLNQHVRLFSLGVFVGFMATPVVASETPPAPAAQIQLEPKALDILKAMSAKLAGTQGMSFKAVTTYEKPSRLGPPLAYSTLALVIVQRPDRLRVLTSGDGPATDFYYNGKQAYAFAPKENLLAQAEAPDTIDATLEAAYQRAAIYFPFTDVIVSDPYKDLARDMRLAFYIGQSTVVGDTTTDVIAYANDNVFVQAWIGTKDKLPRMLRAVFRDDPSQSRHQVAFSDWKLASDLSANFFQPEHIDKAQRIQFAAPPDMRVLDAEKQPVATP